MESSPEADVPKGHEDDASPRVQYVDPRVILANERTLLAWVRTCLAFIGGGLAVTELLGQPDVPGGRRLIGLPLIVAGAVIAGYSHRRWQLRERSLAVGQPLAPSRLPALVSAIVVVVALVALLVAGQTARS